MLLLSSTLFIFANNTNADEYPCSVNATNLLEVNQLLTDKAKEYHIPPEIVKGIVSQENGSWDYEAVNDDDGDGKPDGFGLMQVTSLETGDFDKELLIENVCYNVDAGLHILNDKWNNPSLPVINQGNRNIIENWYFAVMAYNGTYPTNSPLVKDSGKVNDDAYQEEVWRKIETGSFVDDYSLQRLPFTTKDFDYDPTKKVPIKFNVERYVDNDRLYTHSSLNFAKADIAQITKEVSFYRNMEGNFLTKLSAQTLVEILEEMHHVKTSGFSSNRHWVRYKVKIIDGPSAGQVGYVSSAYLQPITSRLSGESRYETAIEISKDGWYEGTDNVIIARGDDFPDALAGTTLSSKYDAPILLTEKNSLPKAVQEEIVRLGASKAIILGGTSAVSTTVQDELSKEMGLSVNRLSGKDRFETAIAIANHLGTSNSKAIVATGFNFPDALAIAPYAAQHAVPIFLTNKEGLDKKTLQLLNQKDEVIIVGSEAVVSKKIADSIHSKVTRLGGVDRFETARDIIKELSIGHHEAFVATGYSFPDALTGAALAAKRQSPILFTKTNALPPVTEDLIKNRQIVNVTILGGISAVATDSELAEATQN